MLKGGDKTMKKIVKKLLTSKKLRSAAMLAVVTAVTVQASTPTAAWN